METGFYSTDVGAGTDQQNDRLGMIPGLDRRIEDLSASSLSGLGVLFVETRTTVQQEFIDGFPALNTWMFGGGVMIWNDPSAQAGGWTDMAHKGVKLVAPMLREGYAPTNGSRLSATAYFDIDKLESSEGYVDTAIQGTTGHPTKAAGLLMSFGSGYQLYSTISTANYRDNPNGTAAEVFALNQALWATALAQTPEVDVADYIGDGSAVDAFGDNAGNNIALGGGNDLAHARGGSDTIKGEGGHDIVWAGAGYDDVRGGSGQDQLWGQAENDTMEGGAQSDLLIGGTGDDELHGDGAADTLLGGSGIDSIFGGKGDDVIVGGSGKDYLVGGSGKDRFTFHRADSGPSSIDRDEVLDFEVGEDRMDLTQAGVKAVVSSFSGQPGEARIWTPPSAAFDVVEIDLNGDLVADVQIEVHTTDMSHITAADIEY
jgi:Ca2+-binding RTX toxin-like protein